MAPRRATGLTTEVVVAVARRPRLWPVALQQARALARRGWWRRPPFLPVPPPAYLGFRLETQYGDPAHRPEPEDVLRYLAWCQRYPGRRR